MKNAIMVIMLCVTILFSKSTRAQSDEAQQLALNVQKLAQFKKILSNMKKGYEILNGGYTSVKNLTEGNFNLHKTFLDALLEVSPSVKNYKKVADIIRFQKSIITEYKAAYARVKSKDLMSDGEIKYIGSVYSNLVAKSLDNLEDLTMVVTAGKLRMSDDERLQAIDRIYDDMQDKLVFLRAFNNNTSILIVQREKEQKDAKAMKSIYGLKQ